MDEQILKKSEYSLLAAIQTGFPLTPRPFHDIGKKIGSTEDEVIAALGDLCNRGIIKRMGVIVRHRELGFKANAMVVWNIPDNMVSEVGKQVGAFDFVTLCYRRQRSEPRWPYNLYCMIHGRKREQVLENLTTLVTECGLQDISREILFSNRCFKQQGARYFNLDSAVKSSDSNRG
jgi:siroheme decarboxylase